MLDNTTEIAPQTPKRADDQINSDRENYKANMRGKVYSLSSPMIDVQGLDYSSIQREVLREFVLDSLSVLKKGRLSTEGPPRKGKTIGHEKVKLPSGRIITRIIEREVNVGPWEMKWEGKLQKAGIQNVYEAIDLVGKVSIVVLNALDAEENKSQDF